MNTLLISIGIATLGIDVGWQRLPEGGMEYIIQLDAQSLEALCAGQPISSDIPPSAGEVRSYRIIVGKQKLRRENPPARLATQDRPSLLPTLRQEPPLLTQPVVARSPDRATPSGQPANFEEPQGKPAADKPQPQTATKPASDEPAKPWLPLLLTLFGLFGSLGANVYLGWIALELRQRCRSMISARQPT